MPTLTAIVSDVINETEATDRAAQLAALADILKAAGWRLDGTDAAGLTAVAVACFPAIGRPAA